jgi:hypothetical protein
MNQPNRSNIPSIRGSTPITNAELIWRLNELRQVKPALASDLAVRLQNWITEQYLETPEMAERRHQAERDNDELIKAWGREDALDQICYAEFGPRSLGRISDNTK